MHASPSAYLKGFLTWNDKCLWVSISGKSWCKGPQEWAASQGKAVWQRGRQRQCSFRREGQSYSSWTRIAEQVPWQPSESAPAHRAAPSNSLTWLWAPRPHHCRAGLWQRQPGPWGDRGVKPCSCPEGRESWVRNKLHVCFFFFFLTETTVLCVYCAFVFLPLSVASYNQK